VPEEVAARLEYLAFVGSTLELREKHAEAVAWCLAEMEVLTAETGGASPFGGLPSHWTLDNLRQATSSVEE
jgi:hypothetical protein